MGGVDLLDRFISMYRPTIQGKKWYWPLFLNCISMVTVAAWRLHVHVNENSSLDLLEFTRSVVSGLLTKSKKTIPGPAGKRIQNKNDGLHHAVNAEKQGRCVHCKKNTVKKCFQCNIRLHPMCFLEYHR